VIKGAGPVEPVGGGQRALRDAAIRRLRQLSEDGRVPAEQAALTAQGLG
jgi:hypothetical protein